MGNSKMRDVRQEQTGERDLALNNRHRLWGYDCPGLDIDFLMVEYDVGTPIALVEYKHENQQETEGQHMSYKAIGKLGTWSNIPVYEVRYTDAFDRWVATPLNEIGERRAPAKRVMGELEFVTYLYRLRGRALPRWLPGYIEDLHRFEAAFRESRACPF